MTRVSQFLKILVAGSATALTFASCSGDGFSHAPFDAPHADPQLTGGQTEDGRLYTAASNDGEIQGLKKRIDFDNPKTKALSESIIGADVVLLNNRGQVTSSAPAKLRISVWSRQGRNSSTVFHFEEKLNVGSGGLRLFNNAVSQPRGYWLNASCADADCRKIVMVLTESLTKRPNTNPRIKNPDPQAGLIIRRREARIQAKPGDEAKLLGTAGLRRIQQHFSTARTVSFKTLEVAWGRSTFTLSLGEGEREPLCVSGSLVQTNNSDEPLQTSCEAGAASSANIQSTLVGNSNAGSLVLRLTEDEAALYLTARTSPNDKTPVEDLPDEPFVPEPPSEPSPRTPTPSSPSQPPPLTPTTGFRIPFDADHAITRTWEADRARPEIRRAIDTWTGRENSRVRSFIARIQPNLPVITAKLRSHNVPTEMMTILMIESRFFVDEGYPVEVAGSSTATGPWQFLTDTAKWLGLETRPFLRNNGRRQADPCDERTLLEPSTNAAGKYFRHLFDEFPNDPRLAVMSYYWGPKNVDDAVDCLKSEKCRQRQGKLSEIRSVGFNFWSVRAYNMAPTAATDYVIKFLSGQFIGRNPEHYGLSIDASLANGAPARSTCR